MTFDKELGGINNDVIGSILCFCDVSIDSENINSTFTELNLPSSITKYSYTFAYCITLSKCKIQNSVTSIGKYAFSKCTGLASIIIPNSVTDIE